MNRKSNFATFANGILKENPVSTKSAEPPVDTVSFKGKEKDVYKSL